MSVASPSPEPLHLEPPAPLIGQAALLRRWLAGGEVKALARQLMLRAERNPGDAHALMDLASLMYITDHADIGLSLQHYALKLQQVYRLPTAKAAVSMRVLAFVAPGDLMANTPLEFLLEGTDVSVELFYLVPGGALPAELPEHDALFVAIGESDPNLPLLKTLAGVLDDWPRPVLNRPEHILRLARNTVSDRLSQAPGIVMPPSVRVERPLLQAIRRGERSLAEAIPDGRYPIIVRPVDSHAGHGLARLDSADGIAEYLSSHADSEFFISPFIYYADADGLFRKYRVALVKGRAFICHMAISDHWIIHYLNAGMEQNAEKRGEEARCMAGFEADFAPRHAAAFQAIATRMGLDYVAIDCAQTHDGKLLVFEVDTAMVVHAFDSEEVFPYKKAAMQKLFAAFRQMLLDCTAAEPAGSKHP